MKGGMHGGMKGRLKPRRARLFIALTQKYFFYIFIERCFYSSGTVMGHLIQGQNRMGMRGGSGFQRGLG
jgi:hypothetical protein